MKILQQCSDVTAYKTSHTKQKENILLVPKPLELQILLEVSLCQKDIKDHSIIPFMISNLNLYVLRNATYIYQTKGNTCK